LIHTDCYAIDRLIMATELAYDVSIMTKDSWISDKYPKRVVW